MQADASLDSVFTNERAALVGIGYRLTGSSSEAEDLVQEAFVRALERPPTDTSLPWKPWLVRVVVNLGKDRLRRRRAREYDGPWLPEALEHAEGATDARHGEARYGELESVTIAFLTALEGLSSTQRAVLILRDVVDLSVAETAAILGRTETYVKVAHHRARERMKSYESARVVPDEATVARTKEALEKFLVALLSHDVPALTDLLRADCTTINDGGGEFTAAKKPVFGRDKSILFHTKIMRHGVPSNFRVALVNGLPTLIAHFAGTDARLANRVCVQVECDESGAIRMIRSTLATTKLRGIEFPEAPGISS